MKTLQSEIGATHKEARDLMRVLYPNLFTRTDVVHHIDQNPFNNNLNNLIIIDRWEHQKLHYKIRYGMDYKTRKLFKAFFNKLGRKTKKIRRVKMGKEILFRNKINKLIKSGFTEEEAIKFLNKLSTFGTYIAVYEGNSERKQKHFSARKEK